MTIGQSDLVDYYIQLERRVGRLERTSSAANNQNDTTFVGTLDVTGVNVASQTVVAYGADYQVYINMGWTAPSFDSNVITDDELIGYYTSFTKDGTNWTAESFTDTTTATIGPLAQGQSIVFRVRAVTQKGTLGDYATASFSTTLDNVAPAQPSTPTATPYLGQVRVYWDGLTVTATAMPADMVACEIHIDTSSITFTPSAATLVDVFYPGGGYYTITDLVYGTTYYVRLVAVDQVGNRSPSSTGTSVVPVQAADGDIASVGIGKLIAGTLSADMTVSARIKTSNAGARVEMSSAGILAYNSSEVQTVNISASTGSATLTGKVQTGTTGDRIIMDASGYSNPTIAFYPASGTNYSFINAASDILGMNSQSGTVSSTSVRTRCILGYNGAALEQINATTQATFGGQVSVGPDIIDVILNRTGNISVVAYDGNIYLQAVGTIALGNGDTDNIIQSGSIYERTSTFTANVGIATSPYGVFYRITSTAKNKREIEPAEDFTEGFLQMRPVTYYDREQYEANGNSSEGLSQLLGLLAEDVYRLPGIGHLLTEKNKEGHPESVNYDRGWLTMVPVVQMLLKDYLDRRAA